MKEVVCEKFPFAFYLFINSHINNHMLKDKNLLCHKVFETNPSFRVK